MQTNLYHVQDDDRPMHVIARDFNHAVECWRAQLQRENPDEDCSEEQPCGVILLAESRRGEEMPDLILPEPEKPDRELISKAITAAIREAWGGCTSLRQREIISLARADRSIDAFLVVWQSAQR